MTNCLPRFFLPLLLLSPCAFAATEIPLMEMDLKRATTGWGEIGKGKDANGGPLKVGGVVHPNGVGVHAPSDMVFRLDGSPARFSAQVAVDDAPENSGSVTFLVVADGETVFDSGRMSKGDAPKKVDVDLTGKKVVALRVTDAGDGRDSDHGDWLDAKFTVDGVAPVSISGWTTRLSHYAGPTQLSGDVEPTQFVTSPDGKVRAALFQQQGRLWIQVTRDGQPALAPSPLGVTVDGVDLGKDAVAGKATPETANETYPWLGNQRTLTNHFNGLRIAMKTGNQAWTLNLRSYDDGVAWRYEVPGSGRRKVTGEATSFALPAGSSYWTHTQTVTYEANLEHFEPDAKPPHGPVVMPVTVELPTGGFACYTEANTMGYSGMTLGPNGPLLNGIFEDDPDGWTMDGAFATPWRVVITAKDLNALVNSSIVQSVCPPPDPKLFPKGILTDWIKPGRSYWTWGFGLFDTAHWDRIKGYVDDAASLNCQYYTIDDPWREPRMGWHRNGGDEWDSLKEICAYAAKKNVGIVVWQHWDGIRDLPTREKYFAKVARAGAKGVKIDFMESESQDRLEFYRSCLEIAARHKLQVNFHGANKPAGEARTWPNGLTREGIYGLEQREGIERQTWTALPFTRLVAGAGDFTPGGMPPDQLYGKTTVALQLAAAVTITSPIEHWMDSAENYLRQPPAVIEFVRTKPTVWDETHVLPGSQIGELAAFARRDGRDWWIGVVSSSDEKKTYQAALPEIAPGKYQVTWIEDAEARENVRTRSAVVDARDLKSITANLAPRGGFAMMIKAVK